jgi:lysophospholipase L1-like esterase
MSNDPIARGLAASLVSRLNKGTRPRIAVLGDSLVQGDGSPAASTFGTRSLTFALAMASGGVFVPIEQAGIGGQTSPMIASRVIRDVVKARPDICFVLAGANDAIVLSSADYITPSLTKINNTLKAFDIPMVVLTLPPNNTVGYQANYAAINTAIKAFGSDNGVTVIDIFPQLADGSNWITDYTWDGRHPTARTTWRIAQYVWSQLSSIIDTTQFTYNTEALDPANLCFAAIDNTGATASGTAIDPLFNNSRSFTQNGFTLTVPYLFATQFGSGVSPTVSGAMSTQAGVNGKVWTITASPNGAGSYSFQTSSSFKPINLTRFQGRRLRIGFKFGCSGFDTDNTDAYMAANGDTPLSGCGITFSARNAAGSDIATFSIIDPVDVTGTVGGGSGSPIANCIPADIQGLPFYNGATAKSWHIDIPLTPVFVEMNVPVGAVDLDISGGIRFAAGATAQVSMSLAEISIIDVGPAEIHHIPTGPVRGFLTVSASDTISTAQGLAIDVFRCDATAGAIAPVLPTAAQVAGRTLVFKKIDASANAVTVTRGDANTIDGATTKVLASQYDTARFYSNGSNWDVV